MINVALNTQGCRNMCLTKEIMIASLQKTSAITFITSSDFQSRVMVEGDD